MVLAPVLILGWGTGRPLGVPGAAIATLIAVVAGVVMFWGYFLKPGNYLKVTPSQWRPQPAVMWGMAKIGVPAGGEFALMSVYMVLVYWIIRHFGAAAQAGFGIGARLMQAMFLPTMAVAFAAAPLAGQNFGARNAERVRSTFRAALTLVSTVMLVITILSHLAPEGMIGIFSQDPAVISFGAEYLKIISFNFLAVGVVFTCSSIFQGMGHTLPPLICSCLRIFVFAIPAFLMSLRPGFQIREVWLLSVATVALQAVLSYYLVRREFEHRLAFGDGVVPTTI
jgi:MATE family, multidrug efflux pump